MRFGIISSMIALNARYDGKVIVPETPLALPANQRVRIQVEPIESTEPPHEHRRSEFYDLIGIGLRSPTNPNARFPDDDSLWEGSLGEHLTHDPRKK